MKMKNKKPPSIYILVFIGIILSIAFITISCITANYNNANILVSLVFIIFMIFFIFIINAMFVFPLTEIKQVLENINDRNYSFYCKYGTTYEIEDLMNEVNRLSKTNKVLYNKYKEQIDINENYIKIYNQDLEHKKVFLASISHEIKTPLTVISNAADAIKDKIYTTEEEIDDALQLIIDQANKTNQMLYTIVSMYKLESSKIDLDREECNIGDLIIESLEDLKGLIIKYNQKVDILSSLDLDVLINKALIQRALKNILVNAITYSPKNERITIELIDNPKYYALEFINYGITIGREDLNKIFEPFYRADKSREIKNDQGNGLGLHIVKEIFDRHGFDYGITNVRNGVKFYIIIQKSTEIE